MDTTAKIGEDKSRHYGRSSIQKVAAGFIPARLMLCRGIGSAVQGSGIKGSGVQRFPSSPFGLRRAGRVQGFYNWILDCGYYNGGRLIILIARPSSISVCLGIGWLFPD
jgi:hypothetical protein